MGMWIGISVLTVAEVLELIAAFLITIFKKLSKREDRVVDVKAKENNDQTHKTTHSYGAEDDLKGLERFSLQCRN